MPALFKPSQYESKFATEFERLWINKTSVLIISNGNDKFTFSDGNRSVFGKGFMLLRLLKRQVDKNGYNNFWNAFKGAPGIKHSSTKRIIISTH